MLGPKYGLLSVVVDNYLEGRVHDTAAVPIRLDKPQKRSFFKVLATKRGGGVRARPLRRKKIFSYIYIF